MTAVEDDADGDTVDTIAWESAARRDWTTSTTTRTDDTIPARPGR